MTTLVRQKHDFGCGVAALAMVTGHAYDDVHDFILAEWYDRHEEAEAEHGLARQRFTERGVHEGIMHWYLARHGFVWRQVYIGWKWEPWPPEPFAPVHVAQVVQPSTNSHYVVMTASGVVLDPMTDEPRTLTDWSKVNNVMGVWPSSGNGGGE